MKKNAQIRTCRSCMQRVCNNVVYNVDTTSLRHTSSQAAAYHFNKHVAVDVASPHATPQARLLRTKHVALPR
jgi:hypothetical protein